MSDLAELKRMVMEIKVNQELIMGLLAPDMELLTTDEACRILGISPQTLIRKSRLKPELIDRSATGHRKWKRKEILKFKELKS